MNRHIGSDTEGLSRRSFLKAGTAGAVAAATLPACGPEASLEAVALPPLAPPSGVDDEAWAHVRAHFMLDRDIAYMNNASLGMPPSEVVQAVTRGYEAISREPLHGKHDLQDEIATRVVPGLAQLFGAEADEFSLTRNATEALHLQAVGLDLTAGDEVIITTQEHPAGRAPWVFRAERHDIAVNEVFVPSPLTSGDDVVERIAEAITPRTKAISFCHVTRGGHRYPVKRLAQMARSRGVVSLVDGAQAVGQFPIDLHDLGCDAYSASLHKWILAPVGTGFLYVREDARDRIRSTFATGATPSTPALAPPGTADFPVRAAIGAALVFVKTLGLARIEARCRTLSDYLKVGLAEIDGVQLLSGATPEMSAPGSTIFEKEGLDAVASVSMMEERARTHIDEHQRDGHNAIRISTHVYNTTAEIDRLLEAIASA